MAGMGRRALPWAVSSWVGLPGRRAGMGTEGTTTPARTEPQGSVAELYAALTELVPNGRPEPLFLHRGLWGPHTKTKRESLDRANGMLTQGCRLGPGRHVLDAGCGVGGTAIALAETHGVRVTGLTNCRPHVALAARFAQARGVGHLVEFHYGDFMDLPFPDARFDAVLNHESFCYANDKPAYLRGVYRVLKPGGRWQALEGGFLGSAPASDEQRALVATVERNWRLGPMRSWRVALAALKDAGFERLEEQDLSREAIPSTEEFRRAYLAMSFLNPRLGETKPILQEFMDASVCYASGLSHGLFSYRFLSGQRPTR